MAVLMGSVEVRQVFRDWPEDMSLAVCLMQSGECQLVVFRQEEAEVFPLRLQRHLNLKAQEICFFPPAEGYASQAMLYSDERRLMALVAEAPAIVEEALDYSVNFSYALEEGLDPAHFLGFEKTARKSRAESSAESRPQPKPKPGPKTEFVSRRTVLPALTRQMPERIATPKTSAVPSFMRRSSAMLPGPGFRSARDIGRAEDLPERCEVYPEERGWILVERPHQRGPDIRVSNPEMIFLRDDRRIVAVKLEPAWSGAAALPARMWIQARNLPSSVQDVFAESVGGAQLTASGSFLYLQFEARKQPASDPRPKPAADPVPVPGPTSGAGFPESGLPEPVAMPKTRARGWSGLRQGGRRRLLAMTGVASVLVLIGLGLQLGGNSVLNASDRDALIDWDQFRISLQTGKAG